jgi:P27 family predicted phage terminase small subunit
MRGRKPELVAIEGGLARTPGAPSWLPDDAKAEWRRILPELVQRRTVTRSDLATVEAYCLAIGTLRRSQKTIASEGDFISTASGDTRRHPAFQTMFQALTESRRLAAELGLTPASRNKATALEDGDDDELANMVG